MTDPGLTGVELQTALIEALFRQLPGAWTLDRRLESTNALEPAGSCNGTTTFTPREPSVFIGDDGKLDLASAEIVYHEQGYFEMQQTAVGINNRFPFSRKYVWRLQRSTTDKEASIVSIWFTKPGTETIDYLFHRLSLTVHEDTDDATSSAIQIHGDGGHLCVEDLYSSTYTFDFLKHDMSINSMSSVELKGWEMLHEVRGPTKDQTITTHFTKQ